MLDFFVLNRREVIFMYARNKTKLRQRPSGASADMHRLPDRHGLRTKPRRVYVPIEDVMRIDRLKKEQYPLPVDPVIEYYPGELQKRFVGDISDSDVPSPRSRPHGPYEPFEIPGWRDDDNYWIRIKPKRRKRHKLAMPSRSSSLRWKITKKVVHSKESLEGRDPVRVFLNPDFGASYVRPKSDRHIEPYYWRRHHVRAENLGIGKRIYRIPIWRPKIANSPVKWLVLIYIIWNYIRYYTDLLLEMIDKDIAPWEPERFDQLETIGKWLMIYADAIEKWQLDFQDPASPIMEGIINLHHDLMFFLLIIAVFVLWVLLRTVYLFDRSRGHEPSKVVHGTVLEIVWTIVPSFILLAVAIPSFALLYAIDEASDPAITIKVIGHQWYWVYEYSDYTVDSSSLTFESFMVPEADLKLGQLRLLEVDNRIVVPTNTHIRFLITSADVLHSWAVPSLGVKVDALPGRLNQATVFIKRDGVYYGQCSEICGVNHAFMPIVIESVPLDEYVSWVANQIEA